MLVKAGLTASVIMALSGSFLAAAAQAEVATEDTVEVAADMNCIEAAKVIRKNFDKVEVAAHHNTPDGYISHNDMEAVAGGNYKQKLRKAARKFTNNTHLYMQLDTAAQGGAPDNKISREDVTSFIARGTCG